MMEEVLQDDPEVQEAIEHERKTLMALLTETKLMEVPAEMKSSELMAVKAKLDAVDSQSERGDRKSREHHLGHHPKEPRQVPGCLPSLFG